MRSSAILAALTTAAAAQVVPNRIYIATSSSPALVNQWAVIGSPGSRFGFSKDPTLASNLTVTQDSRYVDSSSNPQGLILSDDSASLYAFGAFDSDAQFPRDDVLLYTVRFAEPMSLALDPGTPVLPMVNNIVKSVELRNQALSFPTDDPKGVQQPLDVLQVCGDGGEEGQGVPYYLILAGGYVSECQNVTLRYV